MNTTPKNKIGHPGGELIYNNVLYLNNNYIVGSLKSKDGDG